jgi:hypothetical protein
VQLALRDGHAVVAELRVFPDPYRTGRMSMSAYEWTRQRGNGTRNAGWGTWSGLQEDLEAAHSDGITKDLLRRLPLQQIVAEAQTRWELAASALEQVGHVEQGWLEVVTNAAKQPRRHKRPDALYVHAAARYAALVAAMHPKPVQLMAKETGFTTQAVTDWIKEARTRGFLTPTTPGRAGGQLTDKALAALQEAEK